MAAGFPLETIIGRSQFHEIMIKIGGFKYMEMSEHECKFLRCWDIFPYHTEYGAVDFQRHSIQKTCGILGDKLFSICLNHEFLRRIRLSYCWNTALAFGKFLSLLYRLSYSAYQVPSVHKLCMSKLSSRIVLAE